MGPIMEPTSRVVHRVSAASDKIIRKIATAKDISAGEAADYLLSVAANRLEALARWNEKQEKKPRAKKEPKAKGEKKPKAAKKAKKTPRAKKPRGEKKAKPKPEQPAPTEVTEPTTEPGETTPEVTR